MNKMKKIALIGVIVVLLPLFLACGGSKSNTDNNKSDTSAVDISDGASQNTTTAENIFDGLDEKTYDGREFNIMSRASQVAQFSVEEENGDVINDAVFKRNQTVEDKYDVKINVIPVPGEWGDQDTFINTLKASIMSGDGAYDLVDGYEAYIGNMISAGLYLNLLDVPHLRLTEPWWSQNAVNELTINGKLYIVPGDITTNLWETIYVIFFNKGMLKNFNLDDPYTLVKNGEWTLDKMIEMCKGVSADLNGDGKMYSEDRYGALFDDDLFFNNFHNAFNIPTTLKDDKGVPYFNLGSPEVLNLAQTMYNLATSTDSMTYTGQNPDFKKLISSNQYDQLLAMVLNMFADNQILFFPTTLSDAEKLRATETDFGILPYPKQTKDQAQYKTSSRDQHTMFGIPVDVKDVDFTGLITEALCVASNKIVVPAYYDIALKSKYARDDESKDMLDIIRQGLSCDFGIVFSSQLGNAGWMVRTCVNDASFKFASEYDQNINKYQKALDTFLAAFQ
ncbi:MAG: extracellular solute-binding protein [Oscillospiraceae bacterium]|nr:extracellular solute-binding protein [Oscillospiraceae bacterium]